MTAPPGGRGKLTAADMDALARLAASLDPPPSVLGIPDTEDMFQDRYAGPREADGPQDVEQAVA